MLEVIEIASNVIMPILLCAGVGVWFGRTFKPDTRNFTRLSLYVLIPSLTFYSMSNAQIDTGEMATIALFVLIAATILIIVGGLLIKTQTEISPTARSTFILTLIAFNSGNFGLPFIEFAFGESGLERATLVFVFQAILASTVGVYVVSSGSVSPMDGLKNVLTNPVPYATFLGILVSLADIPVPLSIQRATSLLGNGSIPLMLLILGMQIANTPFRNRDFFGVVSLATFMRLVFAPIAFFLLTRVMGIHGITQQVLIVQLSMPTAVNTIILSGEYGGETNLAATIVLSTTLASVVTLSILLALLT